MLDLQHLPGSHDGEKTVAVLRRHWMNLSSLMFSLLFVLLLPPAFYATVRTFIPELLDDPAKTTVLILGVSIFFLYAWLFLFQNYLDYYLDVWIVTNRRILNIEQHGLFGRTVSELRLHRVQDVTSEIKGFAATMMDFGNVYIQTAGEQERFVFEKIPHPTRVSKIILDLAEVERKNDLEEAVEEFNMPEKK